MVKLMPTSRSRASVPNCMQETFYILLLLLVALALSGCVSSTSSSEDETVSAKPERTGAEVYNKYCQNCHQGGTAGSPRFGDREAWKDRLEKGREALITSVREGMPPGMPKMGLCLNCSEQELAASVDYMLEALEPDE